MGRASVLGDVHGFKGSKNYSIHAEDIKGPNAGSLST